jgi:hemoglobin/transferrin/lactoferrin receptor protein
MLFADDGESSSFQDAVIEEVIVVGARSPRPVAEVVGKVDIITHELLVNDLATSLSDVMRYTPGISVVTSDSRFGETELTIRGLSGNRVATLIDGVPVPDQFDIGSFANAGQDFLNVDAISRVEVLRGPASTLFGNDALGGVVAVITRDPEEFLRRGNTHIGGSMAYSGRDDSTLANVSSAFALDNGGHTTSGVLHVSRMSGHEIDRSATNNPDQQDRDRTSAFAKLAHQLPSGNRLRLDLSAFDEDVDTDVESVLGYGRQFRNTTSLQGDDERQRYATTIGYEFSSETRWLNDGRINAYWQHVDVDQKPREFRANLDPAIRNDRRFEYETDHYGATIDLQSSSELFGWTHTLSWGGAVERAEIEEQRNGLTTNLATGETSDTLLGEVMPVRDFPKSTVDEVSVYVQDEIAFDRITLIPGLRYQAYDLDARADALYLADNPTTPITDSDDSSFAPKFGVLWDATDNMQLYAQYARGFRAPPFEDVNIGLDIPLFNIRAIPNPNLRSETSDGVELGIRMNGNDYRAEMTVFGVDYDDLIETKARIGVDPDTGTLLFQSRNIDKARVYGIEAGFSVELDRWVNGLTWENQASWTRGDNRTDNEPLNSVDPAELVSRLTWQPTPALRLSLITTAVAKQDRIDDSVADLYETDGYAIFDVTGSYQITEGTRVDLGVFNALDKTYWRWASVRNRTQGDPMIDHLSAPARYATVSVRIDL